MRAKIRGHALDHRTIDDRPPRTGSMCGVLFTGPFKFRGKIPGAIEVLYGFSNGAPCAPAKRIQPYLYLHRREIK